MGATADIVAIDPAMVHSLGEAQRVHSCTPRPRPMFVTSGLRASPSSRMDRYGLSIEETITECRTALARVRQRVNCEGPQGRSFCPQRADSALVTIIALPAPHRASGSKMLVYEDGQIVGTGGGTFEHRVIEAALRPFARVRLPDTRPTSPETPVRAAAARWSTY